MDTKRKWEIPAYPARIADVTGVGDAFCGGFMAAIAKIMILWKACVWNISASLKLEGSGPFYNGRFTWLAAARLNMLKDMVRQV